MKQFFKYLLKFSLLIVLLLMGGMYYFFKSNKAPILQGEIEFCINYKEDQLVDVYLPTKEAFQKRPVVVYYHGGAWVIGRKEAVNYARFNGAFNTLREAGYAIVSPSYTLGKLGNSPFPNCIQDAFDVLDWIKANAEQYNFDINNVGVFGESAGAHLALMVAFGDADIFEKEKVLPLQYVVDVYGPTDLHALYDDQQFLIDTIQALAASLPSSLQKRFDLNAYLFGFDPKEDSLQAHIFTEKYSPINYVTNQQIPVLLIHGNVDKIVPLSQTQLLMNRLDSLKIPFDYLELDGVDHGLRGASKPQKDSIQTKVTGFITKHLQ